MKLNPALFLRHTLRSGLPFKKDTVVCGDEPVLNCLASIVFVLEGRVAFEVTRIKPEWTDTTVFDFKGVSCGGPITGAAYGL